MLLRKAVYGIRGTIIKSMLIICILPLTITAIILYLFINNYSNTLAESSLQKSVKYAVALHEFALDEVQYINTIQQTPENGGGFLLAIDENGTYLAHPEKRGSTDSH